MLGGLGNEVLYRDEYIAARILGKPGGESR